MSQSAAELYKGILANEAEFKETDTRILDATVATFAEFGFRGSMEEVARRAGVSRVTLYRRFSDRDALIHAVVLREARRALRSIIQETSALESDEERFVRGFVATIRVARRHPFFKQLIAGDAEFFAKYTMTTLSQVIDLGRTYMAAIIRQLQANGLFENLDPEYLAEMLIRLWHSIVMTTSSLVDSDDEQSVVQLARDFLYPLLTHKR